ncbi:MAG: hypothetical protein O7C70_01810, partial [Candidatus Dadabacteria bacterium]|nr:hypothetical protein [Candidatus Dadabacteria bacterium]
MTGHREQNEEMGRQRYDRKLRILPYLRILLIRCDPLAFESDGTECVDRHLIGIERVLIGTEDLDKDFPCNL